MLRHVSLELKVCLELARAVLAHVGVVNNHVHLCTICTLVCRTVGKFFRLAALLKHNQKHWFIYGSYVWLHYFIHFYIILSNFLNRAPGTHMLWTAYCTIYRFRFYSLSPELCCPCLCAHWPALSLVRLRLEQGVGERYRIPEATPKCTPRIRLSWIKE